MLIMLATLKKKLMKKKKIKMITTIWIPFFAVSSSYRPIIIIYMHKYTYIMTQPWFKWWRCWYGDNDYWVNYENGERWFDELNNANVYQHSLVIGLNWEGENLCLQIFSLLNGFLDSWINWVNFCSPNIPI